MPGSSRNQEIDWMEEIVEIERNRTDFIEAQFFAPFTAG